MSLGYWLLLWLWLLVRVHDLIRRLGWLLLGWGLLLVRLQLHSGLALWVGSATGDRSRRGLRLGKLDRRLVSRRRPGRELDRRLDRTRTTRWTSDWSRSHGRRSPHTESAGESESL